MLLSHFRAQQGDWVEVQVTNEVNSLGKMTGVLCIMAQHHGPPDASRGGVNGTPTTHSYGQTKIWK